MTPPEVCDEHDLPIDQYGCWACGHAGPITDAVAASWGRWVTTDSVVFGQFHDGIRIKAPKEPQRNP